MNRLATTWKSEPRSGFTIIEVLIATFVVGTTMVGLFGFFVLSLRLAQEGERRVVAVALANERAEMIRNLPYSDVGTVGGVPVGSIQQSEMITRNDVTYTVTTDVRYIDDEFDGLAGGGGGGCIEVSHVPPGNPGNCQDLCVPSASVNAHIAHGDSTSVDCSGSPITGPDVLNTDYKQARVEVSWPSPNNPRPILLLMVVAPDGIEGGDVSGTLDFQALDAQGQSVEGATVQLFNDTVNPVVDITTLTNSEGRVVLPGLPEATQTYELTVSRPGYTGEQTYDATATFFPDTDHAHLSALIGQLTQKTFFIDLVARLDVLTAEPRNPASLSFDPAGGDDYVEIPHSAAYELTDGTVSLWFKTHDVTSSEQDIWTKDANGLDNGGHVTMRLLGNQLQVRHQTDIDSFAVSYDGVETERWYHVAYTFGAGGMELYVDGAQVSTNSPITFGIDLNQEPIAVGVGTRQSGLGSVLPLVDPFDGLVDDVRIFDRVLPLADVQTLAGGDDIVAGQVAHWMFNESSGSSAADSVSGNDGTWQGGVTRSFDTPFLGGAGTALGAIDYLLQGTKTIGTDNLAQLVYVVNAPTTTDGVGQASHEDLVWDSYALTIDGVATGYDVRASNLLLPLTVNPADDLDVELYLVDHTPISLHVTVTDAIGSPIADAVVHLTDNGHDQTLTTGPLGQVLFADLPVNADYVVDVTAAGFDPLNTLVTVADTSQLAVQLVLSP